MLNSERHGGWGAGGSSIPPTNPFGQPMSSQPVNPFAQPRANPFSQNQPNGQTTASNPFGATPSTANPFQATASTTQKGSGSATFGQPQSGAPKAPNPFNKNDINGGSTSTKVVDKSQSSNPFSKATSTFATGNATPAAQPTTNGVRKVAEFVQPAWPKQQNGSGLGTTSSVAPKSQVNGKRKSEFGSEEKSKFSRNSPDPNIASIRSGSSSQSGRGDRQSSARGSYKPPSRTRKTLGDDFAEKIQRQLSKDNIKPPKWPANPGSRAQRSAVEALREAHKAYREKARKSLIRAGLIDDPDQRRTLDKALTFRGICQDMCPEWERITRIVEHDIRAPEKEVDETGEPVAIPSSMVKRLARSAAGQDAPLPMDVRSFAALRQTLDYLIDELIPSDDLLPLRHGFLWDRTRAIRIDFTFQKYDMTPEERIDQIYCLETIVRFHVTSLHLLSQEGFAPEDFSEQQEIEQLGKTLISLVEVYDDCAQQGIECENETEFRGYHIVFNAHNPSLMETVQGWDPRFWNSDGIRTAMCLVQSMENTWRLQGPLTPYTPTEIAIDAASMFFSIVAAPQISYTMACFAEIHFNSIRKSILQVIKGAYSRPRDGPKDLTPAFLKQRLHLDTEEEAVEFVEKHGFEFAEDNGNRYLILNSSQRYVDTRTRHLFSRDIVERKRSGQSLPQVIHETVYEEVQNVAPTRTPDDSLFVSDSQNVSLETSNDSDVESHGPTPPSTPPVTSSPTPSTPGSSVGSGPMPFSAKQPATSIFAQPKNSSDFQPTSSLPANTTNTSMALPASVPETKPFGSFFGTANSGPPKPQLEAANQAENQSAAESSDAQETSSKIKKRVTFADTPEELAPSSKDSTTAPSPFSSLGDKSGSKDAASPWSMSLSNPFPGLQPATSGPSNKDGAQSSALSGASAVPGPGFQFSAFSTPTNRSPGPSDSNPPQTPTLGKAQPPSILNTEKPNPSDSSTASQSQPGKPGFSLSSEISGAQVATTPTTTMNDPVGQPSLTPEASSSSAQGSATNPKPLQPTTNKDPMESFTRWFVCGDRGLMESHLEKFVVEHLMKETWDQFHVAEEERLRKEEDDKSWAEARKFREYSLSVTYFYRWLNGFRKRRVVKRIQIEKEKARQWRLPENVAKRRLAAEEAKEKRAREAQYLMRRRTRRNAEKAEQVAQLRESTRLSRESRERSIEDALLASGVFKGVRDEQAAARFASKEDDLESEPDMAKPDMFPAEKALLRSENQRRQKHGLNPLKRLPEPKTYSEGSKTAMLKALSNGQGRDSMSVSTGSLRNSTFSSSYRSSLGINSSRVSKPRSRVSDPYWRLKANGLVQMPNGEYLHESLALPMLQEGKRFPGLGDYGLPPVESTTPSESPPPFQPTDYTPPIRVDGIERRRVSSSPSVVDGLVRSRKRSRAADEDLAAYRNEAPSSRKRARSGGESDNASSVGGPDLLASIASLMKNVDDLAKSTSSN